MEISLFEKAKRIYKSNMINEWYKKNENDIKFLYYYLINLSKEKGININSNQNSFDEFVRLVYNNKL